MDAGVDAGVGYYGCGYRCADVDVDVNMIVGVPECVSGSVDLATVWLLVYMWMWVICVTAGVNMYVVLGVCEWVWL